MTTIVTTVITKKYCSKIMKPLDNVKEWASSFGTKGSNTGSSNNLSQYVVDFLTGRSYLTSEMQAFFMAIQGCMIVRNSGMLKSYESKYKRPMPWFYQFVLSTLSGFAGGWFGFILMAKPTSMFSNDLNMASCIVAFLLVNYTPHDLGYKLFNTLGAQIITVSWAQLFRSLGLAKFIDTCFSTFAHAPSPYYPIPIFGPIMYGTLLGNFGGIILKGLDGHFSDGMPYPVQNGKYNIR